jgi:uncharacterized protein (DUF1330 family)
VAAYITAMIEVTDPEEYRTYSSQVLAIVQKYDGRFLARGGILEILEGPLVSKRAIILEFPSVARAREFYFSPEYQEILPLRQKHARTDLFAIVEGVAAL